MRLSEAIYRGTEVSTYKIKYYLTNTGGGSCALGSAMIGGGYVRGKKEFTLSRSGGLKKTKDQIIEEAKKCDVVCSNDHRRRTYERSHPNMEVANG